MLAEGLPLSPCQMRVSVAWECNGTGRDAVSAGLLQCWIHFWGKLLWVVNVRHVWDAPLYISIYKYIQTLCWKMFKECTVYIYIYIPRGQLIDIASWKLGPCVYLSRTIQGTYRNTFAGDQLLEPWIWEHVDGTCATQATQSIGTDPGCRDTKQ